MYSVLRTAFPKSTCTAFSCREYLPSHQFPNRPEKTHTYRTTGPVAIDTDGHAVHAIPAPAVSQITRRPVHALEIQHHCPSDSHQSVRYSENSAAACKQGERNDDTGLFSLSTMSIPITSEAVFVVVAGE